MTANPEESYAGIFLSEQNGCLNHMPPRGERFALVHLPYLRYLANVPRYSEQAGVGEGNRLLDLWKIAPHDFLAFGIKPCVLTLCRRKHAWRLNSELVVLPGQADMSVLPVLHINRWDSLNDSDVKPIAERMELRLDEMRHFAQIARPFFRHRFPRAYWAYASH
jgi:hypothetical protein